MAAIIVSITLLVSVCSQTNIQQKTKYGLVYHDTRVGAGLQSRYVVLSNVICSSEQKLPGQPTASQQTECDEVEIEFSSADGAFPPLVHGMS
jgi:hypothetical protein